MTKGPLGPKCRWATIPWADHKHTMKLLCASRTQRRQKKYASVRRTRLHVVVAVLCLTLQSGQAKRLTKRQRKRVTWFYHVIGQSEASVI